MDRPGAVCEVRGLVKNQANAGEREAEEIQEVDESALAHYHYTLYWANRA
jgi:hypothetical protein